MVNDFPELLATLQKRANLNDTQLAQKAGVPRTLVCDARNNKKKVGQTQSTKLGKALGVTGNDLQSFIFSAMNAAHDKLLEEYTDTPAEIVNLLPQQLKLAGIKPGDFSECKIVATEGECHVAITMCDGRKVMLETKLRRVA